MPNAASTPRTSDSVSQPEPPRAAAARHSDRAWSGLTSSKVQWTVDAPPSAFAPVQLRGYKFGLIGSVFNAFNHETPLTISGNAGSRAIVGSDGKLFIGTGTVTSGGNQVPYKQAGVNRISATFGQATSWQRPRRYEAGIRFEF